MTSDRLEQKLRGEEIDLENELRELTDQIVALRNRAGDKRRRLRDVRWQLENDFGVSLEASAT